MAQQLDQRDIVIKVKYGDTLRRIGACVHGKLMDHNMSKLRAKIISLFNFSHDADLILTYTDEDGDVVTLYNDDELRDAVIGQHLNPLRINVQLKSTGSSLAKSETSSSAKPCVDEPLKSIPEPIISALSNVFTVAQKAVSTSPAFDVVNSEPFKNAIEHLSKDVKKVASFSPALAHVVEQFSKLGSSSASPPSGLTTDSSGGPSGASTHLVDLNVAGDPKAPNEPILETTELPSNIPIFSSAVNNTDAPRNATQSLYPLEELLDSIWAANKSSEHEKEAGRNLDGKSFGAAISDFSPINQGANALENFWSPLTTEPRAFPPSLGGFNPHSEFIPPISPAMTHPYQRSHSHSEHTSRTFHRGVQCDGCGMHPIVGPRFKSNVKDDYDLCNICFSQMGNETDYTRIDHALHHPHRAPRLLKEFHKHHSKFHVPSPNVLRGCGVRPHKTKLESRFIQDVTVLDGTVMPPSTQFTKIWRLRNSGTVPWPFGTQLVWVGGDRFGDRLSANLEIPTGGFPFDKELDVAVDFTAPSRAGCYVSYWRMASPSGHKFGQRVWVLIQVGYPQPNFTAAAGASFHPDINLNLPPKSSSRNESVIIDVNAEPLDNVTATITSTNVKAVEVEDVPIQLFEQQQEPPAQMLDPAHDKLPKSSQPPTLVVSSSSFYPLINLPMLDEAVDVADSSSNDLEQIRFKELEEMGFRQIDLNREVLRLDQYDLQQSVDDLCGYAEWDPLLSELHEMGFHDRELNKKALIKNSGSIKRTVLDLIAGKMD